MQRIATILTPTLTLRGRASSSLSLWERARVIVKVLEHAQNG